MTTVPYTGMPERTDLTNDDLNQIATWARLVAVQWAHQGHEVVPDVHRAWFEAGRLYEREQAQKEATS